MMCCKLMLTVQDLSGHQHAMRHGQRATLSSVRGRAVNTSKTAGSCDTVNAYHPWTPIMVRAYHMQASMPCPRVSKHGMCTVMHLLRMCKFINTMSGAVW